MTNVRDAIKTSGLVPVVVLEEATDAAPLADALKSGGLPVAEVTFRTAAAADSIAIMAKDPDLLVGAGTVLTEDQLTQALAAGARFIVTPGFNPKVVRACREAGVPVFPGVSTATEIQMAFDEGLDTVKFFPAESVGGASALRALSAPFAMMRFLPTGGISPANLADYLRLPSVVAVGGSWMVASALVRAGQFDRVAQLTEEAVAQVAAVRRPGSAGDRVEG